MSRVSLVGLPVRTRYLAAPIPTAQKRLAKAQPGLQRALAAPKRQRETVTLPPLDTRALSRQYGMDRAHLPQPLYATFRAPLDVTERQFQDYKVKAVAAFVKVREAEGWELVADTDHRIQVADGIYPARDLYSGELILDEREFQIRAWFRFKNPQPLRIELPPHLVRPVEIAA